MNRLENTFAKYYHNLANIYRDLRHKPPIQLKPAERVIKLHHLLNFYIKNPFLLDGQKLQLSCSIYHGKFISMIAFTN